MFHNPIGVWRGQSKHPGYQKEAGWAAHMLEKYRLCYHILPLSKPSCRMKVTPGLWETCRKISPFEWKQHRRIPRCEAKVTFNNTEKEENSCSVISSLPFPFCLCPLPHTSLPCLPFSTWATSPIPNWHVTFIQTLLKFQSYSGMGKKLNSQFNSR